MQKIERTISRGAIENHINQIKSELGQLKTIDNLKTILNLIDLTSLNVDDTEESITNMVNKVNDFNKHYAMNNVAAICVYPAMVSTVKKNLKEDIRIASVAAGFPSSQTFLSVKLAECELAINKGADEIDIVISLGKFNSGDIKYCATEIRMIKQVLGDSHLKVILESGLIENLQDVYTASVLSLQNGADFIKTSTGKTKTSATPQAAYTMCLAIKDYYNETGVMAGLKPAGGISTSEDALVYFSIVKQVLGLEWLNNNLFRFGASSLANNVLNDIQKMEGKKVEKYF